MENIFQLFVGIRRMESLTGTIFDRTDRRIIETGWQEKMISLDRSRRQSLMSAQIGNDIDQTFSAGGNGNTSSTFIAPAEKV